MTTKVKPIAVLVETQKDTPKVWGLTGAERLRRVFARLGVTVLNESAVKKESPETPVIVIRADYVYDKPVLAGLAKTNNTLMTCEGTPVAANTTAKDFAKAAKWVAGGAAPAKHTTLNHEQVGANFNSDLRKKELPYCLPLQQEGLKALEWRIFMGTYKGVTDLVTKYFWPRPAAVVTRWCTKTGITPNMITVVGGILMLYALWAFSKGMYIEGLLAGWIFTFFDTVDGKLARVSFTSSKIGNFLDHGIDLVHPPFWYVAWGYGLVHVGMGIDPVVLNWLFFVIVGGYIFQRVLEGYFIVRFKIHMHIWRKFDSFFRLITARRNPNMLFMTAAVLVGRPDLAIWAIAAWTALSLLVHMEQILSAEVLNLRGRKIQSWLAR